MPRLYTDDDKFEKGFERKGSWPIRGSIPSFSEENHEKTQ
jgi:hypothetical protein